MRDQSPSLFRGIATGANRRNIARAMAVSPRCRAVYTTSNCTTVKLGYSRGHGVIVVRSPLRPALRRAPRQRHRRHPGRSYRLG